MSRTKGELFGKEYDEEAKRRAKLHRDKLEDALSSLKKDIAEIEAVMNDENWPSAFFHARERRSVAKRLVLSARRARLILDERS